MPVIYEAEQRGVVSSCMTVSWSWLS